MQTCSVCYKKRSSISVYLLHSSGVGSRPSGRHHTSTRSRSRCCAYACGDTSRMSYANAVRSSFSFPAKYGWFLAGWAYLCTWQNTPQAGMREISIEEWNATPAEYLLHPDHHPKLFSRCPDESTIENKREQLFKKAGQHDYNPSVPSTGAGHH